jgi:flagellar hook-associated protein 2
MLRIGGLATGLDTYEIIRSLMKAHRKPVDRLQRKRQILEWQREDYRSINSALLHFRRNIVSPLRLSTPFLSKMAESSNPAVVTATAPSTAANATYEITVHQLATTAYKTSTESISKDPGNRIDPDATLASQKHLFAVPWTEDPDGFIRFTIATYSQDGSQKSETFVVDPEAESLNQVLKRISESALSLSAFYEASADKVSISTRHTGNNNPQGDEINFVDGDFLTQALRLGTAVEAGGTDASLTLNGLEITRAANDFTVNGVNFSIREAGSATVTVSSDTEAVFRQIKNFVDEYNALLDRLNGELREPRYHGYPPLLEDDKEKLTERQIDRWEEKARSGLLRHDPILSKIVTQMRNDVYNPVSGLEEGFSHLAHIGITVGSFSDQGKLVIDEAKLRAAIAENPEAVAQLFNKSGATYEEQGLAQRLDRALDAGIKRLTARAGDDTATMAYDPSFLGRQIREVDDRIAQMEKRLEQLEDRYWQQFAALEQAIARMNAQSAWLMQYTSGWQNQ